MDIASIAYWAIALYAFVNRGPALIYIFFASLSFQTVAVIPPALTGGVSLTPGWVTAVLLTFKVLVWRNRALLAFAPLVDVRRFGLLALCAVYGLVSAYFFPRFFEGTPVVGVRANLQAAIPLMATSANLTQSVYFILSLLVTLTFYQLAKHPGARRHILNAILVGGLVVVITGAIDWATTRFGVAWVLAPLRTATYALLTGDAVMGGTRRVVGITSEASSFATLCMSFAAAIFFLRGVFEQARTRRAATAVFLGLLVMLALSTSSTGYVGTAVLLAASLVFGFRQSIAGRRSGPASLLFAYAALFGVLVLVVLVPSLASSAGDQINGLVFQKSTSESYAERSFWNQIAMQGAAASHWLGLGLGSVRASSWLVCIIANIGVPGVVLLFSFLGVVMLAKPPHPQGAEAEVVTGAKFALIPILAMAALSGTSVSFDQMPAMLIGVIGGLCWALSRAEDPAQPAPLGVPASLARGGPMRPAAGLRNAR